MDGPHRDVRRGRIELAGVGDGEANNPASHPTGFSEKTVQKMLLEAHYGGCVWLASTARDNLARMYFRRRVSGAFHAGLVLRLVLALIGAIVSCHDAGGVRPSAKTPVVPPPPSSSTDAQAKPATDDSPRLTQGPMDDDVPPAGDPGSPAPQVPMDRRPGGAGLAVRDGGALAEDPVSLRLPPVNGDFDYQLGGAYAPPASVTVAVRDREATPASGLYNICYVNGFQAQPSEEGQWEDDLLLRDDSGRLIIDEDWDEAIADITTPDKRARIADVVGGFIDGCADAGFDAVEIDNLDTYSRSRGRISRDHAVAMMGLLSERAHARGLPIAQKNAAELLSRAGEMGTDFVVVEECATWTECATFIDAYGEHVLMIEYVEADFERSCQRYGASHAIVFRDVELVAEGRGGYAFRRC